MGRILFPATNRVHLARQRLLLEELRRRFEVDVVEYPARHGYILNNAADAANHFRKVMGRNRYDLLLARGDRYEVLPIAMTAAYRGIGIAHIEGGDLSGAIDNKVRKAITSLSDVHFATNPESYARLIGMGTDPGWTFDFGSLDVEYATSVASRSRGDHVVMCHHAMEGESAAAIERIVREEFGGRLVVVRSNSDNGAPYGDEEYGPEEYIALLAGARCLVGNSSSFLKEASAFGTPVVNIGERQRNRLTPPNVKSVPFDEDWIRAAFKVQLGAEYEPSGVYRKEGTSRRIADKIGEFLTRDKRHDG